MEAHLFLAPPAEFPEPLPEFLDGDDGQREDDEGDDRPFPVLVEDHTDQTDDRENVFKTAVIALETDPWMRLTSLVIREMRIPVGVLVKNERERVWRWL